MSATSNLWSFQVKAALEYLLKDCWAYDLTMGAHVRQPAQLGSSKFAGPKNVERLSLFLINEPIKHS